MASKRQIQNVGHIKALKAFVDKKFHDHFISIVSFTKRCTLKIDLDLREISSNEIVIYDLYLTETINRKVSIAKLKHKEPLLTNSEILQVYNTFNEINIIDPKIREEHNKSINEKQSDTKASTVKCVVCDKTVSSKVKNYCLSNKKFKGKIYCYEHQKLIDHYKQG